MTEKKLYGHVNPGDVILVRSPDQWRTVTNTTHSKTPTGVVKLWYNGQQNFISGVYNDEITCVDYKNVKNDMYKVKDMRMDGNEYRERALKTVNAQITKREQWLKNALAGSRFADAARNKDQLEVLRQIHSQLRDIR